MPDSHEMSPRRDEVPSAAAIYDAGERLLAAAAPDGGAVQRIAIAGALTTDFIARAVAVGVHAEGVFPVVHQSPFGAYVQELLDPTSGLSRFAPDLVLLAPDWRDLVDDLPPTASPDAAAAAIGGKIDLFRHLWAHAGKNGRRLIQHLPSPPARLWGGTADRLAPASPFNQVRRVNEGLLAAGAGHVTFLDLETLAAQLGSRKFAPERLYHNARLGFDTRFLPAYLAAWRGAWRLANGRAKKVLALDLDNTLWGGVIGDDGVEGIRVGAPTPAGEAFAAFQHYAAALRARGVILAACSKNDPAIAEVGFTHPHSVLRRSDFAAFECSWADKAQGLRNIAAALNVGIDSIVFADDNEAECALVRDALPQVATIHLGKDPAAFIELIEAGHWFHLAPYTAEDARRGEMYAARAAAAAEAAGATDLVGFLRGLGMVGRFYVPEEADIARVAQLEMKTNQFNLTTRRYTEAQIRDFLARDDMLVFAFRLSDRFADHGLVSTLIAVVEGDTLRIDSWLMSCRVFSRGAERFILRGVVEAASAMGLRRILGEYRPTAKNTVVSDLWSSLGFRAMGDGFWERDLALDGLETAIAVS